MKHVFPSVCVVLCLAFGALSAGSQAMSHEEEVVRNTYAKVTLLCAIDVLTKEIAMGGVDPKKVSQKLIDREMAASLPSYEISNVEVGDLSSVRERPLSDFESEPGPGQRILRISGGAYTYADRSSVGEPETHWLGMHVDWKEAPADGKTIQGLMSQLETAYFQRFAPNQLEPKPVKTVVYKRYAAYNILATYLGESTGRYKAFFLFGSDAEGKEYVIAHDLVGGENSIVASESIFGEPSYPEGFLQSRLREHPVIANWLRTNEMQSADCTSVSGDVCCSRGRCGISQADLNHDFAVPLPPRKVEGEVQ